MNKKVKQMWLKALRSGKYKQGIGQLRNKETNEYCCLGVLSDLAVKKKVCTKDTAFKYKYDQYIFAAGGLQDPVIKWAELESADPVINPPLVDKSLSELNDSGTSFKKIANIIEKNL